MKKNSNLIVRHFSPAWFAASMGTGGFANLLYQLGENNELLKIGGEVLWIINIIMFIVFLIPWGLRWFLHFDKLLEDLKDPIMSNFFVTMPVAALILGTNFFLMGGGLMNPSIMAFLNLIIWIFGTVLALILSVYVMYNMMFLDDVHPNVTNFAWFIAPVASIVVPLLGNMLVKYYFNINLSLAKFINIIDLSFFGIGIILFIILASIVLNRFIYHKMPHVMALPTFWIILGPIGIGTIALMGLGDVNQMLGYILDAGIIKILAIIFWGYGFWAFGLIILISLKYLKTEQMSFSLSWWAFIFPLASYTLSSLNVYQYTQVITIFYYTIFLTICLSLIWLFTFIKTLIGIFNAKLLIPLGEK